jgi:hypothetical protein
MRDPPSCRGQAVPDPPARQGWQIDAKGCGGAATLAAGAVGSERPGLKPRAQSASPLKGAVRRPGARVDRLGAGAVWISRLQPAWGLSPAVHGRAIVERAARLVGAACRARRVGHAESPRPWRGRARQRLAPTTWATHPRSGIRVRRWGAHPPSCRGQALPDPSGPPGPADHHRRATAVGRDHRRMPGCDPHVPRLVARAGEAAPRPYNVGEPIPGRAFVSGGGALTPVL